MQRPADPTTRRRWPSVTGRSSTSSASAQSSSSTGWSTARTSAQRVGIGLDPPAQRVGGVPQLLARELEGDEGRRPGRRSREGGHVDARARAPRRHVDAQRRAVVDVAPGARRSWRRR